MSNHLYVILETYEVAVLLCLQNIKILPIFGYLCLCSSFIIKLHILLFHNSLSDRR